MHAITYFAGPIFEPAYFWLYLLIAFGFGGVASFVAFGWIVIASLLKKSVPSSILKSGALAVAILIGTGLTLYIGSRYFDIWDNELFIPTLVISVLFSALIFLILKSMRYNKWIILGLIILLLFIWFLSEAYYITL